MSHSSLGAQVWQVLTMDHIVLPNPHVYPQVHVMNNTCIHSPAAERHRTLDVTQFPSYWE